MRWNRLLFVVVAFFAASSSYSASKATRASKDGWIIVKLSGSPHDIGFQHGSLLAPEIQDTLQTLKAEMPIEARQNWSWFRDKAQEIFWPKLDQEYKDEISAIAEGARSKGVDVDAEDILAMNGHIELWMYYKPVMEASLLNLSPVSEAPNACSAFVATGSETKDGQVVMGQNFWWDYISGERWNVIFDVTPERGNHFIMDSLPGLIMSGTDWAENSAGIALTETTISEFVGFDKNGAPEFERMRKAIQYSNSLEDVCANLEKDNNGAYANTWLMADANTNEIGKLELGLKNVTYSHTKNGYYFGANFPESPKLIAEEASGYSGESQGRVNRWTQDLTANKGAIDVDMAEKFLGDSYDENDHENDGMGGALCGKSPNWGAVSARVTTSDMIKKMDFYARFGIPDGTTLSAAHLFEADPQFRGIEVHDVPSFPWTTIQ